MNDIGDEVLFSQSYPISHTLCDITVNLFRMPIQSVRVHTINRISKMYKYYTDMIL